MSLRNFVIIFLGISDVFLLLHRFFTFLGFLYLNSSTYFIDQPLVGPDPNTGLSSALKHPYGCSFSLFILSTLHIL